MLNYNLPERRMAPRVYTKIPLMYTLADESGKVLETKTVMTGDISQTGMYFYTEQPLPLKTEIKVSFKLPKSDNAITGAARVIKIESTENEKVFGIGIVFTQLEEKYSLEIRNFVERLDLRRLLEATIKRGASDLHLLANHPPVLRILGDLEEIDMQDLNADDIPNLLFSIMTKRQIRKFEQNKELDFGLQYDAQTRFRVNLYLQRGFLEAVFRLISAHTFSFEELNLPAVVKDLARLKEGLVLIVGPTGAGKSTTIAAMVDLINKERKAVIVTLERPIEFVHKDDKSIIKQREVGIDTNSFSAALQSSLRQDPNVIVVGELEDAETVKTALIAAGAGYLVIGSFHALNTIHAFDRLASVFPVENRKQILGQLSNCLRGMVIQLLVPTLDKKKRVLASEVLMANDAVKKLIRSDELIQLPTAIQTGVSFKMQSMYTSIKDCVDKGLIDKDTARFCLQGFGRYSKDDSF